MTRRVMATLVLAAALVAPGSVAQAAPPDNSNGLTVVGTNVIDARQTEYTVSTAALIKPVRIRVVMPTGYDPSSSTRYPVLYLYHGTAGRPSDWITSGDALATTAGKDLILVLPEAGYDGDGGGFFNNEWNRGQGGGSQWETFQYEQVIGWIDHNFPTLADRDHRAIAGLSQGGYGAMHGAVLHPDMFASVASFSGAPDIFRNTAVRVGASLVIEGITVGLNKKPPFTILGSPITNAAHWQGHDPATLAENLRGMQIGLWTAAGIPGKHDSVTNLWGGLSGNAIETLTHVSTLSMASYLQSLGIARHFDNYLFGTHTFPYWAQDLREYVPMLMDRFAHPQTPSRIAYGSTATSYSQWDWSVSVHRTTTERLTKLRDASMYRFSFESRDPATIVTPAWFTPGRLRYYTVATSGGSTIHQVIVPASGRLTIEVPGNANVFINRDDFPPS